MKGLTIRQIQDQIQQGKLSYKELVQYYLTRINKWNDQYKGLIAINQNALEQAELFDRGYENRDKSKLLYGIPILIKDNINTAFQIDGMATTCGAEILRDFKVENDAFLVTQLRNAGAILLGKTNLSEFANFKTEDAPNGYSVVGGQTLNPFGPFDVGGSSSGSGSSIALDFCCVSIGTETSGSIISPSTQNGIVAIKPSVGLISRNGIMPISWTQDTAGPMAKNFEDLALLMNVLAVEDTEDDSTHIPARYRTDFLSISKRNDSIKFLVPQGSFIENVSNEKLEIFKNKLEALKVLGHQVNNWEPDFQLSEINWDILFYEFPIGVKDYLKQHASDLKVEKLEDIISFNEEALEKRSPHGQIVFDQCIRMAVDYESQYENQLKNSLAYSRKIDETLDKEAADYLLFVNVEGADWAARAGYPSICIPIGQTPQGEPVGMTITGKKYSDAHLLQLGQYLSEKGFYQPLVPQQLED